MDMIVEKKLFSSEVQFARLSAEHSVQSTCKAKTRNEIVYLSDASMSECIALRDCSLDSCRGAVGRCSKPPCQTVLDLAWIWPRAYKVVNLVALKIWPPALQIWTSRTQDLASYTPYLDLAHSRSGLLLTRFDLVGRDSTSPELV
jgi:hypothetical protein